VLNKVFTITITAVKRTHYVKQEELSIYQEEELSGYQEEELVDHLPRVI